MITLEQFLTYTNGKRFYVMDTETTGFTPDSADVIEVSAIKVLNDNGKFKVIDTFDSFVNPEYPLPDKIVEFNEKNGTGICDELLSDAPKADGVTKALLKFFGDDYKDLCVVGHNIDGFDVPFIDKLMGSIGYAFEPVTFDTLLHSRSHDAIAKHNLGTVFELTSKEFSKGNPQAHLSIGDCYMTLDVMNYHKEKLENRRMKNQMSLFDIIKE